MERTGQRLIIGLDVGSITVKAVVVDGESLAILWSDYRRHHARQAELALQLLEDVVRRFRVGVSGACPLRLTGSGAGPLTAVLGGRFVQEVNAVTLAVEALHPDAGSVIELGGQDAKIIHFSTHKQTGERRSTASMNDKCASGTGATIDKCLSRAGLTPDDVARLHFREENLHRVSAKCGVFAETDIANLVKSGVPADEIVCSLADAIVMQNLSVLARGSTLRPKVLLLGGPNRYLPVLQECWRLRIRQSWQERGFDWPDQPLEELILIPPTATLYAAYGAALHGLREQAAIGMFRGLEALRDFIARGRRIALSAAAGPPLVRDTAELADFLRQYSPPLFVPRPFPSGGIVAGYLGFDGGSTSSKCVLIDAAGEAVLKIYRLSGGNPLQDMKAMLGELRARAAAVGSTLRIDGFGVTGYAADVLAAALRADVNVVETVAHMRGASHYFPEVDVVCDIGGQDVKVLMLRNGELRDFRLSTQCSAGNGMMLQAMAEQFGVPVADYAEHAFRAEFAPRFNQGCAVFLDTDRVNFQQEGFAREELMAGLAQVLPKNVWQYVARIPRLAELGRCFVLQGGTQSNLAAVKAQVDYIRERVPDADIRVHPHPGEAGAIGAALEAQRVVRRRGSTTFVGLDAAISLAYVSRNDADTQCSLCASRCPRTFIDTHTPDGFGARHVAGFGCDKGEVDSLTALRERQRARRQQGRRPPNLVAYEARRCFRHDDDQEALPSRGLTRSNAATQAWRGSLRIGMPKALGLWSIAPFLRAYFETLGIAAGNLIFSDDTSERLFAVGGKYGSNDPCFPAKVAQAHIHNLLFPAPGVREPLHFLFFPTLTHLPNFVAPVIDNACCPVVSGTPNVIRAAFTKENDFFARAGIDYVDAALTMNELNLLRAQLFACWGARLRVTAGESDFAVGQGWRALDRFHKDMEARGRRLIEQLERDDRIGILLLGRPYHSDPGINHEVTEALQALGYPVLSIRSIPKDTAWLTHHFGADLAAGTIDSPLDIRDVWPENYSVNSTQKVWAAKFAARHPNIAVLDLSSFKCGNDAPVYGLIDRILTLSRTPFASLHDIDANRPAASIAMRLRTFAQALRRREEQLQDAQRERRREACRDMPQYREHIDKRFVDAERATTTLLMAGLTIAQDQLFTAALRGLGFRAVTLDPPDNEALRIGKEFGNRGQCNPTYFMVGNLLKFLRQLRDVEGVPVTEIVRRYVFITAAACGPCRFGSYLTEYRKALHDAGFEGFRVLTLSQTAGLHQQVGEGGGFRMSLRAFLRVFEAFVIGDLLNLLAYRIRPYEIEPGATDVAVTRCRELLVAAFEKQRPLTLALWRCRQLLLRVAVDRSRIKPRVAIIGEFWAMTTEGDGNYRLQRLLEAEGAEVEIQTFTSWMLYVIWQGRFDTAVRRPLQQADGGRRGLRGVNVAARLARLVLAERLLRGGFAVYARLLGLRDYHLPDMDEIARIAHPHYNNHIRGGEGHMEVGKLIDNVVHGKVGMTLSIKPFGCMPSSGVSDGVQSLITERHPQALFLSVETTGDGRVGVHSRIQMQLHKAQQRARAEVFDVLDKAGLDEVEYRLRLAATDWSRDPLHRSPRRAGCTAADLALEIAAIRIL